MLLTVFDSACLRHSTVLLSSKCRERGIPHIQPETLIWGQTCSSEAPGPGIALAGNDGHVQCVQAGTAAGAWWRKRPEEHRCTDEALMHPTSINKHNIPYRQAKGVFASPRSSRGAGSRHNEGQKHRLLVRRCGMLRPQRHTHATLSDQNKMTCVHLYMNSKFGDSRPGSTPQLNATARRNSRQC